MNKQKILFLGQLDRGQPDNPTGDALASIAVWAADLDIALAELVRYASADCRLRHAFGPAQETPGQV